ncbi:DUF58 domain-containing protein [Actinoplanes sp. TBRC 11911]|uniref:DUF58 domain-containing protein n=1 Tax=Actinoplanes sp. TBRC 11911 TaxID=2729386 RepID=UPI00145D5F9A|nr:DUF58 domain-containing protein [Actinoplanes sp. TBRC 11911]NMO54862.1 DUF58 domain-containing protein [Actinoplanes sp. TBRC 11911]
MVTRRFAVLVVLGIPLPLLLPWPWLAVLAVVLVAGGIAAADAALAGPLTSVALRRDGDRTVWLGGQATVTLTVVNEGTRDLRLDVRDSWVPSAGAGPLRHRLTLAAGEGQNLETTLLPVRHGNRPAARVTVRSYGPLGLAYRQRSNRWNTERTPAWNLRVLPHFPSRRILPEKLARMRVIDGSQVTRGRGQGTEFDALRSYVLGDDVRSIDWRSTARAGHVVVRTWRPERDRRVYCVLDTGRTSAVRVAGVPRLDSAIDAALLLSVLATRAEDRVDLLALDAEVRARVEHGGENQKLARIIDGMASLEPALAETDYSLLATELLRRGRKPSLVVIFTALDMAPMIAGLLPLLPQITARHHVIVAGMRDPEVTRLASLPGKFGAADVHTAAAAQRSLAERDRIADVLGRFGATVVDAGPSELASRVADLYLLLKATGRL